MKKEEVKKLAQEGLWQGKPLNGKITETHISWVILSDEFVFKIKKPVQFSFLDFSNLEKRKHFCEREVELNSRLTDIYKDVVSIHKIGNTYTLGKNEGKTLEYAVRMQKVNPEKEMGSMLKKGLVTEKHLQKLAKVLVHFHTKADVIKTPFDIKKMKADFNDLQSVKDRLEKEASETIDKSIEYSNRFLRKNQKFIEGRSAKGYRRDLHGDFHSGNIFLTENPNIFDCIEFNDEMRKVDILDEIAFFCMDLEAQGFPQFSQDFLGFYKKEMALEFSDKETELFNYFKLYRANVRTKVNALKENFDHQMVRHYLKLMSRV